MAQYSTRRIESAFYYVLFRGGRVKLLIGFQIVQIFQLIFTFRPAVVWCKKINSVVFLLHFLYRMKCCYGSEGYFK